MESTSSRGAESSEAVIRWLLDADPSIRWQVLRDVVGASADVVTTERSRVATEGWGARMLDLQKPDGNWGCGPWGRNDWTSTLETLALLREMGLDPSSPRARRAIGLVRDNSEWGPYHGHAPFFEGETDTCINGRVLVLGAYFGQASDGLVDRLLNAQLPDGGWNCDAPPSKRSSFNTTICVLEGLLEYEIAQGATGAVRDARLRGQEYLLERRLFRSLSTGQAIERDGKGMHDWFQFSFPNRWRYDVLWGLDYLRKAGGGDDVRASEAKDLLLGARDREGWWPLGEPHAGEVHFDMEGERGAPSRWNTLRALRVLEPRMEA